MLACQKWDVTYEKIQNVQDFSEFLALLSPSAPITSTLAYYALSCNAYGFSFIANKFLISRHSWLLRNSPKMYARAWSS
ncbi:unnamed protein product [Lathyrus oleraceus]